MDMATDKWPFCLNMTVYEAGSVIEALATKCTAVQNEANDLRYENNGLREKTNELDSRVRLIERKIGAVS
jgi:hypothetical protein